MAAEAREAIESKRRPSKKQPAEEKEACPICADHYTTMLRKKLTCRICNGSVCRPCMERYLLTKFEDPHCIHCRVAIPDEALRAMCSRTYLSSVFYEHRRQILLNRERASLPALQDAALRERKRRQYRAEYDELQRGLYPIREKTREAHIAVRAVKNHLHDDLAQFDRMGVGVLPRMSWVVGDEAEEAAELRALQEDHPDYTPDTIELLKKIHWNKTLLAELRMEEVTVNTAWESHRQRMRVVYRILVRLEDGLDEEEPQPTDEKDHGDQKDQKEEANAKDLKEKEDKRKFIRRCMRAECNGFLSTAWKCGLCEWYSCPTCFSVKGPTHDTPHECKKEDIETAEMIKRDSKPCPKCGEFIYRTSGCNMMFCISCKTPWDWVTGKIVTKGHVHNPHYYEWLQRTGGQIARNPADVPCGGYPRADQLLDLSLFTERITDATPFRNFHRLCIEVQAISENRYRSHFDENPMNDLHIRFLVGDFNEEKWAKEMVSSEKRRKFDAEIQEIFGAFRMVAVELINRIQNHPAFQTLERRADTAMYHQLATSRRVRTELYSRGDGRYLPTTRVDQFYDDYKAYRTWIAAPSDEERLQINHVRSQERKTLFGPPNIALPGHYYNEELPMNHVIQSYLRNYRNATYQEERDQMLQHLLITDDLIDTDNGDGAPWTPAKVSAFIKGWFQEVIALLHMIHQAFRTVSLHYGCSVPYIKFEDPANRVIPSHTMIAEFRLMTGNLVQMERKQRRLENERAQLAAQFAVNGAVNGAVNEANAVNEVMDGDEKEQAEDEEVLYVQEFEEE